MRTIILCTIGIAFYSTTNVSAADDPAAIVDKAIEAMGGEEKLAKSKAEQWKAKGTIEMMGMKMAYNADYFFQKPGQMRFDIAMEFGGMKVTLIAATDGKVAWEKMGDMLRDMEAKKAKAFHDQVYSMALCQLLPLKDKETTLALADTIKVEGNEAVGIKVSRKDRRDTTLYFDKKSGLLVKSASKIWDEFSDKDVEQEVVFTGWKEKDGIKYFEKLTILRGGKPFIVEEMSDQKALEKLDPKVFAKP